jgi:predicted DCC family thiol-disulfide oxidoreductase YuxK
MASNSDTRWTDGQYAIFRGLLGVYLFAHFVTLLPYGVEVFSSRGMLADAALSPLMGIIPNVLSISDSPLAVDLALLGGAIASAAIIVGRFDRFAALVVCYLLACLFARNPLIANPSLPVVGWLLLLHVALAKPADDVASRASWRLPTPFLIAAWVVLAVSYSYSGYTKLMSPSWVSGDAVALVLENPLARDNILRAWLTTWPGWILRGVTWGILFVELFFAPFALLRSFRPWLWIGMLFVQLGFLALLSFADLTAPMLLLHLLTLELRWLRLAEERTNATLYYDGNCALCHALVRFALIEDQRELLTFAPLQGELASKRLSGRYATSIDTIVLQTSDGRAHERGDAVIEVLRRLGGLWGLVAALLALVPRRVRDAAYNLVGRYRLRVFGTADQLCPVLPPMLARRFCG